MRRLQAIEVMVEVFFSRCSERVTQSRWIELLTPFCQASLKSGSDFRIMRSASLFWGIYNEEAGRLVWKE